MMRSLYSGVAGLKNHQTRMDVVGNNIANVNTVGYKSARTTFQDMLSQSVKGAAGPTGTIGGVNPLQVGLGMGVASVDNIFTTGSMQSTGKNTDLAIDGEGFFMVQNGLQTFYTRAGNFDFDSAGNYVIPGTGLQVMGWLADANGNINSSGNPVPLKVNLSAAMPPKATAIIGFTGNLCQDAAPGTVRTTYKEVYDRMGTAHRADVNFTKVDDYIWTVTVDVDGASGGPYTGAIVFDENGNYLYDTFTTGTGNYNTSTSTASATVTSTTQNFPITLPINGTTNPVPGTAVTISNTTAHFTDANGNNYTTNPLNPTAGTPITSYTDTTNGITYTWNATAGRFEDGSAIPVPMPNVTVYYSYDVAVATTVQSPACNFTPANGAALMTLTPDLTAIQHYGIDSSVVFDQQDGYTAGTLDRATLSVDANGVVYGRFSNGRSMNLGQVALALFTNPGGLTKVGSSLFAESNNSGVARIGVAGEGGYGAIKPSTLEMSNVDLSEEFTSMITTQRGFQANSRIITTSDSLLEELVNLKR